MQEKQKELTIVEQNKEKADEILKEKKKEAGKITRELAELEQKIRVVVRNWSLLVDLWDRLYFLGSSFNLQESESSKKHPMFIKAKEKVSHSQKKLSSAKKSLEQAKKADEAHQADIAKLEEEIQGIRRNQKEFEQKVANESQRRGTNVVATQVHVEEYDRLKQKAEATSAKYVSELESINREQKSDQDLLDNELNKKENFEGQLEKIRSEKDEAHKRIKKLEDHINDSVQALEDQKRMKEELKNDVGSSKERIAELQRELEDVRDQLGDAKGDKHEDARRKKKQEVVELFKREVPGVVSIACIVWTTICVFVVCWHFFIRVQQYDRMINMCQPTHKRYNVAVTKVLGKYMEAIIVDTEKTARRCIQVSRAKICRNRDGTMRVGDIFFFFFNLDFERANAGGGDIPAAGLSASQTVEAALTGYSWAQAGQIGVRCAEIRAAGNRESRFICDKQCAGVRDTRRCNESCVWNWSQSLWCEWI